MSNNFSYFLEKNIKKKENIEKFSQIIYNFSGRERMNIKKLRQNLNKTQEEVAKEIGIPRTMYARIESGESNIKKETLLKIADYFHTTVDAILEHEVPYLLDKSTLTPEQREIVELVPQMNYEECKLMLAYLEGVKQGIKERNEKFNLQN